MFKKIYIAMILTLLVGCETTSDPRQGGLISGVVNLSNGGYDRRIESLEARANRAREESKSLSDRNQSLNRSKNRTTAKLNRINTQIGRTNNKIANLNNQIKAGKTSNQELEIKAIEIKQSISDLNNEIAAIKALNADPKTIQQLNMRKQELEKHYLLLLELLEGQL